MTEEGQPLLYIGEFRDTADFPGFLRIGFISTGKWFKLNQDSIYGFAVCEKRI